MCLPDERETHEQGVEQLESMLEEAYMLQLTQLDVEK